MLMTILSLAPLDKLTCRDNRALTQRPIIVFTLCQWRAKWTAQAVIISPLPNVCRSLRSSPDGRNRKETPDSAARKTPQKAVASISQLVRVCADIFGSLWRLVAVSCSEDSRLTALCHAPGGGFCHRLEDCFGQNLGEGCEASLRRLILRGSKQRSVNRGVQLSARSGSPLRSELALNGVKG